VNGIAATPKGWIESFGEITKFCAKVVAEVLTGRPLRFFGETLRQAGILIVSSTLVIWGLVFIIGLQCGIEGAYFTRGQGAPAYAGVFSAWCDLRELVPYAFGYMMAAKVGTGIVAELGSMRISDEIDALEVMGISGITFLCATRLLAAWLVLPFVYLCSIGAGFFASYLAVVQQIGEVSSGGFFLIFWQFQNPHRDREVDGVEHRRGAPHRNARDAALLGRQPEGTYRRLTQWLACDSKTATTMDAAGAKTSRAARRPSRAAPSHSGPPRLILTRARWPSPGRRLRSERRLRPVPPRACR
jgi:phospholipid/cholesterol/gamma-HCH transport system permease protein